MRRGAQAKTGSNVSHVQPVEPRSSATGKPAGATLELGLRAQAGPRSIHARLCAFLLVAGPLVTFCAVWILGVDADAAWSRFIPIVALLVLALATRFLVVGKNTTQAIALFFLCLLPVPVWFMVFRGGF